VLLAGSVAAFAYALWRSGEREPQTSLA
jgi:hypothetical protein